MSPRLAFVTAAPFPDLYEDDRLAVAELERLGCSVSPVRWDIASQAQLEGFDALVVRSVWDWFTRRDHFREFLTRLGQLRTRVFNAPQVLLDFADKTYLERLAAKGVPVVPTVVLRPDELQRVPALLADKGWTEAVLKPAFTANAFDAHRLTAASAGEVLASAVELPPHERWLLQPYVPEIVSGEWSFLFYDGRFSHSVRKVPREGDWRVQSTHGGVATAVPAGPELVAQAEAMLARAAPDTLYARVDGVVLDGTLRLMELEVVEPELFFRLEPLAPERFARALLRRLAS